MSLLSQALTIVDQAYVYDNSGPDALAVIAKFGGEISFPESAQGWKTRCKTVLKDTKEIERRIWAVRNIGAAAYTQANNINHIDEREEYKQRIKLELSVNKVWTSETDKKVVIALITAGYKEERIKNALRKLSPYAVGKIAEYYIEVIIAEVRESLKH
jgi:tRNA isopentenyl-2-thiomethyl-A-37 hydroxylase MiaE